MIGQDGPEAIELVGAGEVDRDLSLPFARLADFDLGAELVSQLGLQRFDVRGDGTFGPRAFRFRLPGLCTFVAAQQFVDVGFDHPHAPPFLLNLLGELSLLVFVADRQQGPRVAGGQRPVMDRIEHIGGELEQPHQVGDGAAVEAQTRR